MDTAPLCRRGLTLAVALAATAALGACNRSPVDKQADAIRQSAHDRAEQIQAQGDSQARSLDDQAHALDEQAKQAGGYTGERLKVRSEALSREADIIKRQAKTQASAATEAADAQAKALQSR